MSQSLRRGARLSVSVALTCAVQSAIPPHAVAATFIKANNTNLLNDPASWAGGLAPPADGSATIQWDSTVSAANAVAVGDNLQNYLGISVLNPGGPVIIDNDTNGPYTFLLGAGGIDLSNATQNLTINAGIGLNDIQTWNVAASSALTINGAMTTFSMALTIIGAGNTLINSEITSGNTISKYGSGVLTFAHAQGTASNYSLAINNGALVLDFTAPGALSTNLLRSTCTLTLGGAQFTMVGSANAQTLGNIIFSAGTNRISIPTGSTLTVSAVTKSSLTNPATVRLDPTGAMIWGSAATSATASLACIVDSGNNPYVTYGLNDWAATNASKLVIPATYINNATDSLNGNFTNLSVTGNFTAGSGIARSIRFNDSANVYTLTISAGNTFTGGGTLLSTIAAGGVIAGPGALRPNHISTSGAMIHFIQNSTNGDLTISAPISNGSNGTPVSIVKAGPGRVILTNSANAFTSQTYINEGTLSINSNGALGSSSAQIQFSGGTLQATATFSLGTANNRSIMLNELGGSFDVTGNSTLTVAGRITGNGPLTKTGSGVLNLTGTSNDYTGVTTINGGSLAVNNTFGSGTGAGEVTINTGATLAGNGVITGPVHINSGSHLAPGGSIGSLSLNTLTLSAGAILDFEFPSSPGVNDTVNILNSSTLSLGGSIGVNLYLAGGNSPFAVNGTYALFTGVSNLSGSPSNLHVLNPIGTASYSFSVNPGQNLILTITGAPAFDTWLVNGGGGWDSAPNWAPAIPGNTGDIAVFGSSFTGPGTATVNLNGNRTVGSVFFNNSAGSYDLAPGSGGSLTMSTGAGTASVTVSLGAHSISVPLKLNSNTSAITSNPADSLTLNGPVTGAGTFSVAGPGVVILNSTSSVGTTIAAGATYRIGNGGTAGSLGTSSLINSGTLLFNRSDVASCLAFLSGSGNFIQDGVGTLIISANANITGPTFVNAGTLEFAAASHTLAAVSGNGTVHLNPGVSLSVLRLDLANLMVDGNLTVRANTSLSNRTSTLSQLTLAGSPGAWTGRLDLKNNNLLLSGSGANIASQIKQAAHLGLWNGTGGGITSTSALASATGSAVTALAYASGAEYSASTGLTLFDNHTFSASSTLVMYALAGDGNMDAHVTFADFLQLQNNYNKAGTDWQQGDWNYDGSTTFADFLVLQNNYNKALTVGNLAPPGQGSVPEPGSLLLLGGAGVGILAIRRRRGLKFL